MPTSRTCRYHPHREGTVLCQKYDRYFCQDCIRCREPTQYCKFRTACMIWELERHGLPEDDKGPFAEPLEELAAEPLEELAAEPLEEPSAEPLEELAAEPSEEPSAEPSEEPSAEPLGELAAEPLGKASCDDACRGE